MIAKIVAEARMLTFRPVNFVNYSQKVSWSCASIFRYALVCSRLTRDRERALITEVANIANCTFPIRQLGYQPPITTCKNSKTPNFYLEPI